MQYVSTVRRMESEMQDLINRCKEEMHSLAIQHKVFESIINVTLLVV
jgi:hypothetical protein